jgi:hypothetical protein
VIEVEGAAKRQAIAEWRDRHLLAALELMGQAAQNSLAEFEEQLAKAGMTDTVWDPVGFAQPRIDTAMRSRLPRGLADLIARAAAELRSMGSAFAASADALEQSRSVLLPQAAIPELMSSHVPSASPASEIVVSGRGTMSRVLDKLAEVAGEAAKRGGEVLDTLQNKVGIRDRARATASGRIATAWLGDAGDPLPVLAQITRMIDNTSETARMSTL